MLRTVLIAAFLFTASAAPVKSTCFDYSQALKLDLERCTVRTLTKQIKNAFKTLKRGKKCKGGFRRELRALTGAETDNQAAKNLQTLCDSALANAANSAESKDWNALKDSPSNINLEEFFEGKGFLNLETGNFQQDENSFIKRGGTDRFLYVGEDPRKNDHYPTTEASYDAGEAVFKFYNDESQTFFLEAPTDGFENSCEASKTIMCCWHRDRQYLDRNGNCNFNDCAGQDPGDNTDLCWTEDENQVVFPYPGDTTEQDLHCHGFAWADDDDVNTSAKWNNLFYVSLYDHMYKRGYVESITNDAKIAGNQAMCGCVEDMAPVARADCTEAVGRANYTSSIDEDGMLAIEHVEGTFEIDFQACEGYKFVEDFTPQDYEDDPNSKDLKSSNNDLSAFVYKQYLKDKMDGDQVEMVEKILVGYRNPEVNKSDEAREEACATAFENRFPGEPYEEREIETE